MMLVSPEVRQRTLSKGNGYSSGCLWQRVLRSKRSEMYCRAEGVLVPECGAELFGRNRQQIGRGSGGEIVDCQRSENPREPTQIGKAFGSWRFVSFLR